MILSFRSLHSAASNVTAKLLHGQVADLRRMPADRIGAGGSWPLSRYRSPQWLVPAGPPVLFAPSPGVPSRCFDLRRGAGLAEHVVGAGRLAYLLDHRAAGPADPEAGVAEWVLEGLPAAVRRVSLDAGGQPVQLVGWSMGGLLALLAAAADPALPVASVAAVAPGAGVSRPRAVQRLAKLDQRLMRPYSMLTRIDDRDHLEQMEAMDHFTAALRTHPGRVLAEPYAAFLSGRNLIEDGIRLGGRHISLDGVRVPVLAIAGSRDRMAPPKAVHALIRPLHASPQVRFEIAPGDHLGVLTGRSARGTTWAYLDRWLDEGILRHGIRPTRREAATV